MTALNFPSSPTFGQTYSFYTWDGEKWYLTVGGTGAAAPGPPGILTGLVGWWDASVYASMTLSGSNITAMADQSGAGNHLTSTANDPVYSATGLNSLPTMVFTGLNHVFRKTSFALGGNTLTVFAVMRMHSSCTSYGRAMAYWSGADTDHGTTNSFIFARDSGNTGMTLYRSGSTAVKAITAVTPHRVIATVQSSGALDIYVDNVIGTTSGVAGNFAATGNLAIGNGQTGSSWYGEISEIGIATGYSNSTVVGQLDTYLKTKWGLA